MKTFVEPPVVDWSDIIRRPVLENISLTESVTAIIDDVRQNGDTALLKYTRLHDHADITTIKVDPARISEAASLISQDLIDAIHVAKTNIEKFHTQQAETFTAVETSVGVTCWRKSLPIQKVGLYIPGGSAPLFSTLLMLGIPAKLAGCKEIIVCTPPDKDGMIHPAVLYVAGLLGIETVYNVGGAQAIAAMAYGTETIPSVFKIFGPGNQYVTAAKQVLAGRGIAIDMPAGPSEVAVYADQSANPAFVAADLLSQAEHGPDSQVVLVAASEAMTNSVRKEIELQTLHLSRKDTIEKCLVNSHFIVLEDVETAFEFLNSYAPEHLIIASDSALLLAEKVLNAGSVFLGHYAPESVGDYASGTNHTLPTNGHATAFAGVSLDSFIKKITFQNLTPVGLNRIGKAVQVMAEAEGLDAHKNAVTVRIENLKKW